MNSIQTQHLIKIVISMELHSLLQELDKLTKITTVLSLYGNGEIRAFKTKRQIHDLQNTTQLY